MIYLGIGVLAMVAAALLLQAFVASDPAKLARGVRVFAITVAATGAAVLLILLLVSGRFGFGLIELAGVAPLLMRTWAQWRRRQAASAPPSGKVSEVETDYLRMRLEHESGTMSGTVRRGRFQGRQLHELGLDELIQLWRECRADDQPGATLLEGYLNRMMPDWRQAAASAAGAAPSGDAMTAEEAYAILGLATGAGEAEIREAHRRLMLKIHPDHGGSTYLAVKINRARDFLLGR